MHCSLDVVHNLLEIILDGFAMQLPLQLRGLPEYFEVFEGYNNPPFLYLMCSFVSRSDIAQYKFWQQRSGSGTYHYSLCQWKNHKNVKKKRVWFEIMGTCGQNYFSRIQFCFYSINCENVIFGCNSASLFLSILKKLCFCFIILLLSAPFIHQC